MQLLLFCSDCCRFLPPCGQQKARLLLLLLLQMAAGLQWLRSFPVPVKAHKAGQPEDGEVRLQPANHGSTTNASQLCCNTPAMSNVQ
jgi:hypothetical protein